MSLARHTIKGFAALFGLDPSSRARLNAPQGEKIAEDDPMEEFLNHGPRHG
jgi:phage terminase small subunit